MEPGRSYIAFRTVWRRHVCDPFRRIGKPQPLTKARHSVSVSFTPDGRRLSFIESRRPDASSINQALLGKWGGISSMTVRWKAIALDCVPESRSFPANPAASGPFLSADGRWMAYSSDESGTFQVYVRAFPTRAGSGKSRTTAARTRCGRATDMSFFSGFG